MTSTGQSSATTIADPAQAKILPSLLTSGDRLSPGPRQAQALQDAAAAGAPFCQRCAEEAARAAAAGLG